MRRSPEIPVEAGETLPPSGPIPVRVRSLRIRDWRPLTRLLLSTFPELDPQWLAEELRCSDHRYAVAITDTGLAGAVRMDIQPGPRHTRLSLLVVNEALRGRGIASELLQYAQEASYACGARTLTIETQPEHRTAHALLRRTGFEPVHASLAVGETWLWTRDVAPPPVPDWQLRSAHAPGAPMGFMQRTAREALYGAWVGKPA